MNFMKTAIISAVGLSTVVATTAIAKDVYLKMDAFPAGSSIGQFGIAYSTVVQKYTDVKIQVSTGKPGTKSAIDSANKRVDLFTTSPAVNFFMRKKMAMYKKVKNSDQMVKELRGLINYGSGPYHVVVYEGSGIKSLKDIKGKKVFLGPPGSLAARTTTLMVAGATGYKPGVDFEAVKFDWQTAATAFVDRQMDVMFQPTTVPSPIIQQFALVNKIRFLGIPAEAMKTEAVKKMFAFPGRAVFSIPAGIYPNQVNKKPVTTLTGWVGLGTNRWMSEKVAYDMTKAFWEHLDEVHATAKWMSSINKETALMQMNMPLHIGAYKYYKEAGFTIADALVPPEAK
ncbi:MAG: TAXI family TRAP transporter solute-binding subunit [Alphaproteobacteria bacterium]|jgi:uncharacterized protein|nr:TAXI family TRAP transporter solute-binding subunit [Alphaproteobacteria bacterium]MBT4086222.1 TAXI family TRAP transporter solute-binding subunit [Alphaproteobacteria bacterium]MBT4543839.1 TAXI family TRAP transporter solute-binding subunit [Alphaproteobacteria bacterium]MBT7744819.1 TAXI family TRAP transporter solute-binding subunit [Alphaproteobacteria bacterium]